MREWIQLAVTWPWPRVPLPLFPVVLLQLPVLIFYSFLRMLSAYVLALIFSLTYGVLAASHPKRERWMIPLLDVLQSVPVLGFFPAAIYFFIALTGGGRVGVELASIFLIFTSMAWNMAFGVYESIKTLPREHQEAMDSFGAGSLLKFSRLILPACIPKLVFNSMLSWAGGWYFLIACEIISLGPVNIELPGLGTFLSQSVQKGQIGYTLVGILLLALVIFGMDVVVWRPYVVWSQKFRFEAGSVEAGEERSVVLDWLRRSERIRKFRRQARLFLSAWFGRGQKGAVWMGRFLKGKVGATVRIGLRALVWGGLSILLSLALVYLFVLFLGAWSPEAKKIPTALLWSFGRVLVAYALCVSWTLPLALWAMDHPRVFRALMPVAEIGASLPATAFFPLIVLLTVEGFGGMNLSSILLIMTGMQWYLLFNLLAGIQSIPRDLREVSASLGLPRLLYWKKVALPAILPSLITGSITGWGGGFNALIVSEYVVYKRQVYSVPGVGSLLDYATYEQADSVLMILTLAAMVGMILLLNRLVWRRLYQITTSRYKIEYG